MTILNHFNALKKTLIKILTTLILFSLIMYYFSPEIIEFIRQPVEKLVFISPSEAFLVKIKVSLMSGFMASFPIISIFLFQYLSSGMKKSEKKFILLLLPVFMINFALGLYFCWKIVLPIALNFLLSMSFTGINPMISFKLYVSFITLMLLAFGSAFEMPVLIFILAKLKIINPAFLLKRRGYIYVAIFLISAIITPPDVISQSLLAGPLIFMFEVSSFFGKLAYRR